MRIRLGKKKERDMEYDKSAINEEKKNKKNKRK